MKMRITTHFLWRLIFAISQIFPVNGNLFVSPVPKLLGSRSEYHTSSKLSARVPERSSNTEHQPTVKTSSENEVKFVTSKILKQFNIANGSSGCHIDTNCSEQVLRLKGGPNDQSFSNSELLQVVQNERDYLDQVENTPLYELNTNGTPRLFKTSRPRIQPFLSSEFFQAEKSLQLSKNGTDLYDEDLAYTSSSSEVFEATRRPETQELFSSSHSRSESLPEARNLEDKRSRVPNSRSEALLRVKSLQGNKVLVRYQDGDFHSLLEKSLERLLLRLVETYLKGCNLILIADRSYQDSIILDRLAKSSNLKQVVFAEYSKDLSNSVVWSSARCQGTLILASDPELLYEFGNENPFLWDYKAKVVLAGLTEEFLDKFTRTKIGRKTEHIVGIVKDNSMEGRFKIYRNQLFWGDGMTYVTTWNPGRSAWNKADLFPDKVSNLRRGEIRVIVFEWQPAIIYHRDENGNLLYRYGRDTSVVEALAQVFNFTVVYKDPPDGQQFGLKLPNGTFDGMVGLLGSDDGDLAIANLYMSAIDGRNQFQEYSAVFAEDVSKGSHVVSLIEKTKIFTLLK